MVTTSTSFFIGLSELTPVDFSGTSFVNLFETLFVDFSETFFVKAYCSISLGFYLDLFFGTYESIEFPYLKVNFLGIAPKEVMSMDALYFTNNKFVSHTKLRIASGI